jgi:hypothetical protein
MYVIMIQLISDEGRSVRNVCFVVSVHPSYCRFNYILYFDTVRDSTAAIATSYFLDHGGVGFRFPVRLRFFFLTSFRPALGPTHPPIEWAPGRKADHTTSK